MFKKLLCLAALVSCVGCAGGFGVNANVAQQKAPAYNCQPMPAQPTPAQPQYNYYAPPEMPSVMVH